MIERFMQWDREFCARWPSPFRVIWRFKLTGITAFLASFYVEITLLGFLALFASALDGYLWFKHEIYYNPTSKGSKLLFLRHDLMFRAIKETHPLFCRVEGGQRRYRLGYLIFFFIIIPVIILIFMVAIRMNMNVAIELNRYLDFNLFPIVNKNSDELIRVGYGHDVPLQRFVHTISIYAALFSLPFTFGLFPTFILRSKLIMRQIVKYGYNPKEALMIVGTQCLFGMILFNCATYFNLFDEPNLSKPSRYNIAGNDEALFILSFGGYSFFIALLWMVIALSSLRFISKELK